MEKIKQAINQLGLSDYETRVYFCLLQCEQLTAMELAKAADVPPSKIYSVIRKLENKHYCTRIPGAEKKYNAIVPSNSISKQIGLLHNQIKQLTDISEDLDAYYNSRKKNNNALDYIEVLKDRDLIIQRTNQLEAASHLKILCLLKSPFIHDLTAIVQGKIVDFMPNVKYINIFDEAELENKLMPEVMMMFQEHGVEVRLCKNIPVKLAIFDDSTVLINTKDNISNSNTSTALIVHHEDLIRAFSDLFDFYYKQSIPLNEMINPSTGAVN